jgi:hypothetical protein
MRHALATSGRLAALVLLIAAFSTAAAQSAKLGAIVGSVFTSNGYAVPGALVVLQSSDGSAPRSTQSDAHGHFVFDMLYDGLYEVRASAQGRSTEWLHNVTVLGGKETRVALHLQSEPRRPTKPRMTSTPKSQ